MSYLPPEEAGFFEAIQVYFTEACDRMALFGARDRALLEKWKEEGRSARLVCRGIREAVASYGKEDPPRSMAQCEAYVDEEWEKQKERRVGSHSEPKRLQSQAQSGSDKSQKSEPTESAAQGLLSEARQVIEEAGRQTGEERWRRAYRKAWREMERLNRQRQQFSFVELEAVDTALVDAYVEMLEEEERQLVEESLASVSAGLLRGMSPSAKREHLQIKRKQAIVDHFGLLDLIAALGG